NASWDFKFGNSWRAASLTPLLCNYKSLHASAFGSHACICQSCNASWDL
ncbi:unnamed protein product, partial [Staurois parvus]